MKELVARALERWGMEGAEYELAAARENAVYRVSHGGSTFALRLHRLGYRSNAELRSELHWMAAMDEGGISVPSPCPSRDGANLEIIDGVPVDVPPVV